MNIEQSKQKIEYLLNMPYAAAIEEVRSMIANELEMADIKITIIGIEFTGSQRFGNPNENSDLDVVFTYENIDENWPEDALFNTLNDPPMYLNDYKLDINPIEDGDIEWYINQASQYKKLNESAEQFELEDEKDRIRDVWDIMKEIKYGFINQQTGEKITDRDWIHKNDLSKIYKTNADPRKTIKDKLGICKDQSLAFEYLMNKYHPEDEVNLYALTTEIQGHCVPVYCHNNEWFYAEFAWNNEYGLHGPFKSKDELEEYLNYVYFKNHEEDNNLESEEEVNVEEITDERTLLEDTRNQLNNASRNVGIYKGDKTRGKNRFERKKFSKFANQVQSYNQIDMNNFFKKDQLDVKVPVTGETNSYTVTVRLNGVLAEIARNIKNNHYVFEYKTVLQAITKVFNTTNIFVHCSCDDFKYRFDFWSVVNNYGTTDSAHNPGPGKGIANPKNDKGKGCKHVLLVLSNMAWIMKVTSVITNYINYIAEKNRKAFNKLIFPKLFGVEIEEAKEEDILPDDFKLDTDKNIIDEINNWARNRGKVQKGSTVNPAAGKGKIKADIEEKEED